MAIKVNTRIFNVIKQINRTGVFQANELRQVEAIVSYLRTVKEDETADWIQDNKVLYLTGLLQGFDIDNTQAAQLKDLHTIPAKEQLTGKIL